MQSIEDHEAEIATFGGPSTSPERELMVRMIEQAKDDLMGAEGGKHVKDALEWFNTPSPTPCRGDRPWLYSFHSICEQLDLDIDTIRRGILARYEAK